MPSLLAVVGLTFDGEDIQWEDLGVFLEIARGLNEVPTVRGEDTIVPGDRGRTAGNRVNDVLSIELRGLVHGNGATRALRQEDYRSNWLWVRDLFRPDRARAPLVATLEGGGTATISALPLNILPNDKPGEWSLPSIELEGYDNWVTVPAGS